MAAAGKVIIVTGASRGIGLAISHFLLQRQCRLVVVARSKEPLERLRAEHPEQVQLLSGDLADFSIGKQAADLALQHWNRLDGLVVNHGVLEPVKKICDTEPEEWRAAFDVNVFSGIALIKAALPALRSSNGRIVLVSSGAASHSYAAWGAYGASKAVLNHLAETLAAEEPDVTTLSIRPGTVDTTMQDNIRATHHKHMDPKDAEKFLGLPSNGKLLRPDQPGNVMARLVLDAPKELNGRYLKYVLPRNISTQFVLTQALQLERPRAVRVPGRVNVSESQELARALAGLSFFYIGAIEKSKLVYLSRKMKRLDTFST